MGHSRFMATIESIEVQIYLICVSMIAFRKGSTQVSDIVASKLKDLEGRQSVPAFISSQTKARTACHSMKPQTSKPPVF